MLNVEHHALDGASTDLLKAAKDIDNRLNQLEGDLAPLRTDWTGAAKLSYDQAKKTWDQAIAEMIQLLSDTGVAVDTSNHEYRSADLRGAARF